MPVKIMIDAGHGGYDNGASYQGRREKDDALNLALEVGRILESQGYDVEYTRTDDVYNSPVEKARIGNASGADFFVSIHRNSSPTPNQYNGVQTLIYDNSGIKAEMAANINNKLEEVGYRNINVQERPNLAVLRRTQMPALLVEAGFINSDVDNQLFDSKFNETAQAIADGIDETIRLSGLSSNNGQTYKMSNAHYGFEKNVPVFATESTDDDDMDDIDPGEDMRDDEPQGYQILVGIFRSLVSAQYSMSRLANEGYFTTIYEDDGLYQVRVGDYNNIEEALIAQRELRDRGYETLIVRANNGDNSIR
ncbi:MAG: N-acetylmuramoyl-L-alanine amidase [Lachnospiraceae bacterium]|nr:N-acetylmuramoyl-L-alanine amidase [Lachnospiraceae bacterium]